MADPQNLRDWIRKQAICAVLAPSKTSAVFRSIALGSDASAPPLSATRRDSRHEHEINHYKIQLEIVYLMLAEITATTVSVLSVLILVLMILSVSTEVQSNVIYKESVRIENGLHPRVWK